MGLRANTRRIGGGTGRCTVGLALVLLVAQLATASHQVSGGASARALSGQEAHDVVNANSRLDLGDLTEGGLRMLQEEEEEEEETPAPEEDADEEGDEDGDEEEDGEEDGDEEEGEASDSPAETPTPVAEEPDSETPSPESSEEATDETPTPVQEEAEEVDETPTPVQDSPTPTPTETETETEQPAAEDTPTPSTEQPVTDDTPNPTSSTDEPSPEETPTPVADEDTPTPVDEPVDTESPTAGSDESPSPTGTPVAPEPTGTPAPYAPSTCSNGIPGVSADGVCCKEECGMCGGPGCGAVAGTNGASDCCPDTIVEESGGAYCGEAPCVMEGFTPSPVNPAFEGTAAPVDPSECSNGIPGYQDGEVCCLESCGTCGGAGCGSIPGTGGSANCCPSEIIASGTICGEAPCIIEGYTPAPAVVGGGTAAPIGSEVCSNGILGYQDGPVCCAANCGQCGAAGCGSIPGTAGASACCSSTIAVEGDLCSVTEEAPCIIDNYTPAPVVPDYGTAAPVEASVCSNGLAGYQNNDICCLESCGLCGGEGCGTIPGTGGSSSCCPGTIRTSGEYCGNGVVAPCIIGEWTPSPVNPAYEGTAAPVEPTVCSNGLPGFQNGAACCKESCGQCGGEGCGTIPGTGGSESCCASDVLLANQICGGSVVAPCVIANYTPAPMGVPGELQPFATSMCSNGMEGVQDENICCAENCGQCGGVGCGTLPGTGGSESCCSSTIAVNGTDCSVTGAAPCIMSDWVPTPSPTMFIAAAPVVPSNCTNGLPGYQDGNVCCLMECGQCGGTGCGNITGTAGASDCCPSTILNATGMGTGYECGGDVVAPCVLPETPMPTPAPAKTPFPTPAPNVVGNANDFLNASTAAAPGLLQQPVALFWPVATATAALLGGLAFLGGGRGAAEAGF